MTSKTLPKLLLDWIVKLFRKCGIFFSFLWRTFWDNLQYKF